MKEKIKNAGEQSLNHSECVNMCILVLQKNGREQITDLVEDEDHYSN